MGNDRTLSLPDETSSVRYTVRGRHSRGLQLVTLKQQPIMPKWPNHNLKNRVLTALPNRLAHGEGDDEPYPSDTRDENSKEEDASQVQSEENEPNVTEAFVRTSSSQAHRSPSTAAQQSQPIVYRTKRIKKWRCRSSLHTCCSFQRLSPLSLFSWVPKL